MSATGRQTVLRGVGWVGAGHVVSQLAWFGSLMFAAALVSPAAFGSVTIAMVVVQVAWLVVGSGTRGSFVVTPTITRAQVRYAVAMNVGTGIVIGVAAMLLSEPVLALIAPTADADVLRVLALSISLYGFSIVPLALLQKELQFKRHAATNAGAALISAVVAVAAGLLGAGLWTLVARQIAFQALLAVIGWAAARPVLRALPRGEPRTGRAARPQAAGSFFLLAVIAFVALNVDYVVVGRFTDVTQLGLYSFAFTIAFAPMTQFAWQVGKVLFPAAARTESIESVGARAVKAVRIAALILLPAVPPAIALAPVALPGLLGPGWRPMVLPFQILIAVGAVHALLAIVREFLLGAGKVRFCVRIEIVWLAVTAGGLAALVAAAGIRGAALTHAILIVPLAVGYGVLGARRIGTSWRAFWSAVQPTAGLVIVEAAAVAAVAGGLLWSGVSADAAWLGGAGAAVAVIAVALARARFDQVLLRHLPVSSLKARAAA